MLNRLASYWLVGALAVGLVVGCGGIEFDDEDAEEIDEADDRTSKDKKDRDKKDGKYDYQFEIDYPVGETVAGDDSTDGVTYDPDGDDHDYVVIDDKDKKDDKKDDKDDKGDKDDKDDKEYDDKKDYKYEKYKQCKEQKSYWKEVDCKEYKKADGKRTYYDCKVKKLYWKRIDCKYYKKKDRDKNDDVIVVPPPENDEFVCPRTFGYWKNHHVTHSDIPYSPAQEIPWPDFDGAAEVPELTEICTGETWLDNLHTPPAGGDAFYILSHQYIAAVLNVAIGAEVPDADAIDGEDDGLLDLLAEAEALLEGCPDLRPGAEDRSRALELAEIFDEFNQGLLGTEECVERGDLDNSVE